MPKVLLMKHLPPKVLLVDDDEVYLFAAGKTIEATGLADSVDVRNNGQEAIDYLINLMAKGIELPDVIFIDINMPVMDGWEFLEKYRELMGERASDIKIYILSSSVDKNDIQRSKQFDCVAEYIIKPVYKGKFTEILGGSPA